MHQKKGITRKQPSEKQEAELLSFKSQLVDEMGLEDYLLKTYGSFQDPKNMVPYKAHKVWCGPQYKIYKKGAQKTIPGIPGPPEANKCIVVP